MSKDTKNEQSENLSPLAPEKLYDYSGRFSRKYDPIEPAIGQFEPDGKFVPVHTGDEFWDNIRNRNLAREASMTPEERQWEAQQQRNKAANERRRTEGKVEGVAVITSMVSGTICLLSGAAALGGAITAPNEESFLKDVPDSYVITKPEDQSLLATPQTAFRSTITVGERKEALAWQVQLLPYSTAIFILSAIVCGISWGVLKSRANSLSL